MADHKLNHHWLGYILMVLVGAALFWWLYCRPVEPSPPAELVAPVVEEGEQLPAPALP